VPHKGIFETQKHVPHEIPKTQQLLSKQQLSQRLRLTLEKRMREMKEEPVSRKKTLWAHKAAVPKAHKIPKGPKACATKKNFVLKSDGGGSFGRWASEDAKCGCATGWKLGADGLSCNLLAGPLGDLRASDPRFPGTATSTRIDAEPLICVVVTAYNVAEYLGKCLETVTQQTIRNLEIIVVDDASTDNSASVISQYLSRDERIRSLLLPSGTLGGAGQPTNRGIESCSPESEVESVRGSVGCGEQAGRG
jgi:hypothetical protein